MEKIIRISSVSQIHNTYGIMKPMHPLIAVLRTTPETPFNDSVPEDLLDAKFISDLYMISMKDGISGSFMYGRNSYDFEEGVMTFIAPNQVIASGSTTYQENNKSWAIIFHPDLLRKSELGQVITNYSFFDYDVHEALHLSDKEKNTLNNLVLKIEDEIQQNTDIHTQKLIISNLELLLNYCTRYYDRQFYTRTNLNKDLVSKFENLLKDYYQTNKQLERGIPSVNYCAQELNISTNYLSDLLKKETGRNALNQIQSFIIEKAKTILLMSNEPVSQIAFELGFDYSQHFSKMFKNKTGMTPKEYRNLN